ncbi:kynureninase [Aureimonas mangrovi]|uniref:kynureninase n=1 Tax=Aureimonas mangrovi TaxID=2758041 RepID=UPI00163DB066|nr:kynureninase [Aureimonas mangrovi]
MSAFHERAAALDAADPLAGRRELFVLPEGLVYLDGNSLGALTKGAKARVAKAVEEEWGRGLISSWNDAGWVDLPARVGAKIAALVGADPGHVVACDSTSVNLFKVLAAALALRPGRRVIVSERANFPTDLYMVEGLSALLSQGHELRLIETEAEAHEALGPDVAVLMLTHVNYRTGAMFDMKGLTQAAHDAGALAIWDLAHSAGAVPLDLAGAGADFAVGCGYKYLNGGPGAPAFLYVAPEHLAQARQPLSGWFGHKAPFAFVPGFEPADGIAKFLTGTPSVLAMSALDAALDAFKGLEMATVRGKSVVLCDLFVEAVEASCSRLGLTLASPREAAARGSQISFAHENAYAVMQALIEARVVGDFRAPDLLRFGFTPLYTRFADVLAAADALAEILRTERWREERFQTRRAVT